MTEFIIKQIMAIRNSGATNMLDINQVQWLAHQRGFYELVVYIEEHRKEYWDFIMRGETS